VHTKYSYYTRTSGVEDQIESIDNARQEKNTVLEKEEITRYIKVIRCAQRYPYEGKIKQYSRTKIERLIETFLP